VWVQCEAVLVEGYGLSRAAGRVEHRDSGAVEAFHQRAAGAGRDAEGELRDVAGDPLAPE
jgi:hypothetical protein